MADLSMNSNGAEFLGKLEKKSRGLIWLALGFLLCVFSAGRYNIFITAWIWPLLFLRFVRLSRPLPGLGLSALALTAAGMIKWFGVIPDYHITLNLIANLVLGAVAGLFTIIPFAADKLLHRRLQEKRGLLSLFVFPLAWAASEFLISLTPLSSITSYAYTQYGNLPFMQLVSVTGSFAVVFLLGLWACVVNGAWEKNFSWIDSRKTICAFACTIIAINLLGGARIAVRALDTDTVRIASVLEMQNTDAFFETAFDNRSLDAAFMEQSLAAMERQVRAAAAMGAKIVNWSEECFPLLDTAENEFTQAACAIARKYDLYLLVPMDVRTLEAESLFANKQIFIAPSGSVEWSYVKKNLVPLVEMGYARGDRIVPYSDTDFSRIASAICFDSNFPTFIRQAGKNKADIFLNPSWDWKGIESYHSMGTTFRAIENGFSLVRNTNDGIIWAVDPYGRTLTAYNSLGVNQELIPTDVPLSGVKTVYSMLGDWFNWACVLGLLALLGYAFVPNKKKAK